MDSALVAWEIILLMSILRTQGIITVKKHRKICFSISFQLCQDTVIELLRRKTFSALSTWNSSGISMAWLRPDEFVSTDHFLQANTFTIQGNLLMSLTEAPLYWCCELTSCPIYQTDHTCSVQKPTALRQSERQADLKACWSLKVYVNVTHIYQCSGEISCVIVVEPTNKFQGVTADTAIL